MLATTVFEPCCCYPAPVATEEFAPLIALVPDARGFGACFEVQEPPPSNRHDVSEM